VSSREDEDTGAQAKKEVTGIVTYTPSLKGNDRKLCLIDLCGSDSESESDVPPAASNVVPTSSRAVPAPQVKKGLQNVKQYLTSLGLSHLVPVLSEMGYNNHDDLKILRTSPHATRESVLKEILNDTRVVLRDWNVLHRALHSQAL